MTTGTVERETMTADERQRLLDMAAKLKAQAKQHRGVGQWIDAKRCEDRTRIMERKANGR